MGDLILKIIGAAVLAIVVLLIGFGATGALSVEVKNNKSGKTKRLGGFKGNKSEEES